MKRPIASGAASALLALTLCGCHSPGPSAAGDADPLLLDQEAGGSTVEDQPLAAADIAAQFEQDLRDFQALRAGAADGSGGDSPIPTRPIHQTHRNEVVFNPPREAPDPGAGDEATGPAANASDADGPGSGGEAHPPDEPAQRAAPPEVRMREAMVDLRRELYQDASYANEPLRQYLTMAALTLIDPDRAIDPDAFPDLRDREREILRAYQDFFIALGQEIHASGDEAKLVDLIDELRGALIEEPQLQIARAELCMRVDGFGAFDVFDKNVFLAGTAQEVVVYTEIEKFTSLLNDRNQWVTDLWEELVIYNSHDNVPVWHRQWQAAPDTSARKRTDFFISHLVTLPDRLTVGQYTLKVRVRDDASGAVAEDGIEFQIVADPTLTANIPR